MGMKLYEESDIQNLANIIREKNGTSETYSISQMDNAVEELNNFSGDYNDLTNKPTLGTASPKDVASSGDASATQVVMGNDSRLTDRRGSTWGQINGTLSNQTDLNNSLNSLQGQIDTFTALPDGSTTGDAELTNIRVDSTGHTYPTAGDAVRAIDAQVNAMKTGFDGVVYNSPVEMVQSCDELVASLMDVDQLAEIPLTTSYQNTSVNLECGKTYTVIVQYVGNPSQAAFRFINKESNYQYDDPILVTETGNYTFIANQDCVGIRAAQFSGIVVSGPYVPENNGNKYHTMTFPNSYTNFYYPVKSGKTYIAKLSNTGGNNGISGIVSAGNYVNITSIQQYQNVSIFTPSADYIGIRTTGTTLSIKEYEPTDLSEMLNLSGMTLLGSFISPSSGYGNTSFSFVKGRTYFILVNGIRDLPGYTAGFKFVKADSSIIDEFDVPAIGVYRYDPKVDSVAIRSGSCSGTIYEFKHFYTEVEEEQAEPTPTRVTVKTDGTGDYTTIQDALDGITDNSKAKPYIIEVYDGTFDISATNLPYIPMKNYVTINGRGKGKTVVVNRKSSTIYNASYSVFDPGNSVAPIEYACIKNMTLISQGGKCPVHIDTGYEHFAKGGKIILEGLKLVDENTIGMSGASFDNGFGMFTAGGVNCGIRAGQNIIVRNCESNGAIYAHNTANQNSEDGAYFEITNCICNYTSVSDLLSNSPDRALIQGSRIKNLRFASHGTGQGGTDNTKYNWSVTLIGNTVDRIVASMVGNSTNPYALFDTYFNGTFAITSSDIHHFCYNASGADISRGDFVEIASYEGQTNMGTLIKAHDGGRVYGVAMEDMDDGETGVVQTGGVILCEVGENVSIGDGLTFNGTNLVKTSSFPEFVALQSGTSGNDIFVRIVNPL